jgi:hypothetical protein
VILVESEGNFDDRTLAHHVRLCGLDIPWRVLSPKFEHQFPCLIQVREDVIPELDNEAKAHIFFRVVHESAHHFAGRGADHGWKFRLIYAWLLLRGSVVRLLTNRLSKAPTLRKARFLLRVVWGLLSGDLP